MSRFRPRLRACTLLHDADTVERAGLKDLVFHDIRRTFATWLTECGVDYAVIRMLRGEPLPGSAKYYIHNWDIPLRDAVTKLEAFTKRILEGESAREAYCHSGATVLPRTIRNPAKIGAGNGI